MRRLPLSMRFRSGEGPLLVACWSAKGGAGTTVVAVSLASSLASDGPALLVDLAGDVPAVLGLSDRDAPGIADWLRAGDAVPADALTRLELAAPAGLHVLPTGERIDDVPPGRGEVLGALLAADGRRVVADCGAAPAAARLAVAAAASVSLLVLRPCFLSLRRAAAFPLRPSGVVLVDEPGHALDADDIESTLGVPVRAVVRLDPQIARAVDAGSLGLRIPRRLQRSLRRAA